MSGLPKLLGADGRPMNAVVSLTKDQRLAIEAGSTLVASQPPAGKPVTMSTALQLSTVYACIQRTAQVIAALPLDVYAKGASGRVREDGPLAELITSSPNADQTALEFWEGMVAWLCATGNAYAEIDWVNGRPVSLSPMGSNQVRPFRTASGDLAYEVADRPPNRRVTIRVVARENMLHLRGWGFGGDEGLSPIRFGVNSMSAAIAADEASGKVFASGLSAQGALTTDMSLTADQKRDLRTIMESYTGSERAGKIMVLERGLKYSQLSINPEDAQMLETRRYSVEEICRWFGVPPIVIGHSADGQTMWGSGVEAIMLSWLQLGVNPILKRVEQRIRKQLIPARDRSRLYAEFNREAMLQMDSASKSAFLREMAGSGTMTANERRAKLNMPRVDDPAADVLWVQGAMVPMRMPEGGE